MPNYAYYCQRCDMTWDAFHKIMDRNKEYCPSCGEVGDIRIMSTAYPVIVDRYSEMADAYFTGPKQKRRILKEKNLEEL